VRSPVGAGVEMRDGNESVKSIATLGRHGGVRGRRSVQIEAEIIRWFLMLKNIGEQTLISWSQDYRVMWNIGILFLGTEIPDKKAV
jgi:hypothetical protein